MPTTGSAAASPKAAAVGAAFEQLRPEECWRLVSTHHVGRVVFAHGQDITVAPASYRVRDHILYFRATQFGPIARHAPRRPLSLQVDEINPKGFDGWSVLLTGRAHQVTDAATLATLWTPSRPPPWSAGHRSVWMALEVTEVQGQRASFRS